MAANLLFQIAQEGRRTAHEYLRTKLPENLLAIHWTLQLVFP